MPKRTDIKKILVIGSGPIIIGQAAEFDYAGSQACQSLREEGYEVILINSNPATIMTDTAIADRVYIGDVSVAGMTEEEATAAVEDYIESLQDTAITLKAGENSIEVTAKDLGVTWGNPELAEKAVNLGRT